MVLIRFVMQQCATVEHQCVCAAPLSGGNI